MSSFLLERQHFCLPHLHYMVLHPPLFYYSHLAKIIFSSCKNMLPAHENSPFTLFLIIFFHSFNGGGLFHPSHLHHLAFLSVSLSSLFWTTRLTPWLLPTYYLTTLTTTSLTLSSWVFGFVLAGFYKGQQLCIHNLVNIWWKI